MILFLCFYLYAQQPDRVFYYSKGEKRFLSQRTDKLFVKLIDDADFQSLLSLIQTDETLNLSFFDFESVEHFVVLESKEGKRVSSETLNNFRKNPNVLSVQLMLENNNGMLRALTDEFVVRFKPTTSFGQ
jgi:hypothetical protein